MIKYISSVKELTNDRKKFAVSKENFKYIKDKLFCVIYNPKAFSKYIQNDLIFKNIADEYLSVVVADLGSSVGSVSKDELNMWKLGEKEIYDIAKTNTLHHLNSLKPKLFKAYPKTIYFEQKELFVAS